MSQWHKILWTEEHCAHRIEGIRLTPLTDTKGKKSVKCSHNDVHPFHELDWAPKHESNAGMHHLHDGVVDHITVHPEKRGGGAISVHALWKDKNGNVVRRDAHMQFPAGS